MICRCDLVVQPSTEQSDDHRDATWRARVAVYAILMLRCEKRLRQWHHYMRHEVEVGPVLSAELRRKRAPHDIHRLFAGFYYPAWHVAQIIEETSGALFERRSYLSVFE